MLTVLFSPIILLYRVMRVCLTGHWYSKRDRQHRATMEGLRR